ncbi:hypothetical protein L6164_024666 [Bauhinia variegata]|uniref:Uncharacterized protein n=1 Tax=Bauhinia variegata TaxID=167791 RepID=A0ACB9LZM4_BAUVA|nr:hypothetical protein L6164_024666 [Bauhinia variegata]
MIMVETEEQIRKIFKDADKGGKGWLSKDELKEAFRQLGSHLPDWRVFRTLQQVDAKKEGRAIVAAGSPEFEILVNYAISKYAYKF